MKLPESKIKWIAGLSNGETLIEGEGVVAYTPGELSPWWKLQEYLKKNELTINSFYLAGGGKHFNLPSMNPRFKGETPEDYNCFRRVIADGVFGGGKIDEFYTCAEAIYKEYKIQLYVNEFDLNKVWINLVKKE